MVISLNDHNHMTMDKTETHMPAGEFKAKCLRLLDDVAKQRIPLVITKRGKPIARLVPLDGEPVDPFGCMAGTIEIHGDIVGFVDELEWGGDAENI